MTMSLSSRCRRPAGAALFRTLAPSVVLAAALVCLQACGASPRRNRAGAVGPAPSGAAAPVPPRQPSNLPAEPDQALQRVDQTMRASGYQIVGPAVRNPSMPENGIVAYGVDAAGAECVIPVVLGRPGQHVVLTVLDDQGRTVGSDVASAHHARVSICGVRGRLTVRLQMVQGQGEYYYAAYKGSAAQQPNLVALFGGAGVVQTQRTTDLDANTQGRIAAREQQLSARGYRRLSQEVYGEVLQSQDARQFDLNLEQGTCYAFATFAGPGATDTDVFVQDSGGTALESDTGRDADAVVQDFCPQQGGRYTLRTLLYAGTGPVFTIGYVQNPGTASVANVIASESTASAGLDENFRLIDADMRARGYEVYGDHSTGTLAESAEQEFPIQFEGGKCYAVLAVGDNGVRDLDLVLLSGQQEMDRDIETDARPVVRVCPPRSGTYGMKVRMHSGQGRFIYGAYRWPRGTRGAFGLSGLIYVRLSEVTSILAVEGYEPDVDVPPGQGRTANSSQPVTHRVRLEANRCYSILAVGGDGVTNVDVELKDGNTSLVRDQTTNAFPSVRHCPTRAGNFTVSIRTPNNAGPYFYQVFRRTDG